MWPGALARAERIENAPASRKRGYVSFNYGCVRLLCMIGAVAALSSCSRSQAVTAPTPIQTTPGSTARTPPTIVAITLSEGDTTEVNRPVIVRAEIADADTTVDKLTLIWSTTAGQLTGTGPSVTWRLPGSTVKTPVDVTITLTVVESFAGPGADGRMGPQEFRVSRDAPPLRVHDPTVEISEMALRYLVTRYGDSMMTPSECLANFSDRCAGKAEELSEITATRARYENLFAEAQLVRVTIDRTSGTADVVAYCRFTSREIATGQIGTTSGTCLLTATYDERRWWLCTSRFSDAPPALKRGGD